MICACYVHTMQYAFAKQYVNFFCKKRLISSFLLLFVKKDLYQHPMKSFTA